MEPQLIAELLKSGGVGAIAAVSLWMLNGARAELVQLHKDTTAALKESAAATASSAAATDRLARAVENLTRAVENEERGAAAAQ